MRYRPRISPATTTFYNLYQLPVFFVLFSLPFFPQTAFKTFNIWRERSIYRQIKRQWPLQPITPRSPPHPAIWRATRPASRNSWISLMFVYNALYQSRRRTQYRGNVLIANVCVYRSSCSIATVRDAIPTYLPAPVSFKPCDPRMTSKI